MPSEIAVARALRSLLLSAFVLALIATTPTAPLFAAVPPAQLLASLPAQLPTSLAAQLPAPPPVAAAACGFLAELAALGFPGAPGKALEGPLCKVEAGADLSCIPGVNCHGYCACECSTRKDCNVNSDCSNLHCSRAISCC